jgi:hypothetical protein
MKRIDKRVAERAIKSHRKSAPVTAVPSASAASRSALEERAGIPVRGLNRDATRRCLFLPVTQCRVESRLTHTKQTTGPCSTRHSRQVPLDTNFRVSILHFPISGLRFSTCSAIRVPAHPAATGNCKIVFAFSSPHANMPPAIAGTMLASTLVESGRLPEPWRRRDLNESPFEVSA